MKIYQLRSNVLNYIFTSYDNIISNVKILITIELKSKSYMKFLISLSEVKII